MVPTLLGVLAINFVVIQFAPGGPVEQMIAKLQNETTGADDRLSSGNESVGAGQAYTGKYAGVQGLSPEFIKHLEKEFGFDKPPLERFLSMVGRYAMFDFGDSYFRGRSVIDLMVERLPVSVSLGLWTLILTYLIAIPLGVLKAVKNGTRFDAWSSTLVIVGYAIPSFMIAILLLIFFAGGRYFSWFPLRGLISDGWHDMDAWQKVIDYLWHMVLPIFSMVLGGFASLTMLVKNSFLEEIKKQYVVTARAKGVSSKQVLFGHIFRNAMLVVIGGFPSAFLGAIFTGALLIEIIFSLDGLGLLGYEAIIQRDYPVIFATLYIYTLLGLLFKILGDLTYRWVDPRIDFGALKGGG